jgi:flagellar biosynthesis/type III secretory pathway M-ring protein FliF/YscJ
MINIINIKLNRIRKNPNIRVIAHSTSQRQERRKGKNMNTNVLNAPVSPASVATNPRKLAVALLMASVAGLLVVADSLMNEWAESHVVAAWLALWLVGVVALVALRGVTRFVAHKLMAKLDAMAAQSASRRADARLWAMAKADPRLMAELQVAMTRQATESASRAPVKNLEQLSDRRAARIVRARLYYI